MRSFIAIELDQEIKQYLSEIQQQSRAFCRKGSYTPRENMHLNFYFLGEMSRDDVPYVQEAMFEIGKRTQPFVLKLSELNFFAKGTNGTMVVTLEKDKSMERLFFGLSKSLSRQGFGKDKTGLTTHITLGKDVVAQKGFADVQKKIIIEPREIMVKKMVLIESKRRGVDLFHKTLFEQSLTGTERKKSTTKK